MQNKKDTALILFLKYPEKGKVKKRLASDIGEDAALELYRSFMTDTLNKLNALDLNTFIYLTPEKRLPDMEKLVSGMGFSPRIYEQEGGDIGERMGSAFRGVFSNGFKRVLLIGSDLPDLPVEYIMEAVSALRKKKAVVGPGFDGGYYLIGFQKECFSEDLFKNIEWSTNGVFKETIKKLEDKGAKAGILKKWHDIDTLKDLILFEKRSRKNPVNIALETINKLKELKIL